MDALLLLKEPSTKKPLGISNNWVHDSRFEKVVKVLIDRCGGGESKHEWSCDPAIDQHAQVSKQGFV
jgi:hypothetical protein